MTDLIDTIDALVNELVGTAKQLLQMSTQSPTKETVEPLQEKQEGLVSRLLDLEANQTDLRQSPKWDAVEEKLQEFQQFNEKFIENMQVRQGLVHFEIKELKKRKHQLAQVKIVYGSKKSVQKGGKSRINTVS